MDADPGRGDPRFFLYVTTAEIAGLSTFTVFYDMPDKASATLLCEMLKDQYECPDGPVFHIAPAESLKLSEQLLLDAAIGELWHYEDSDPGIYEQRPSEQTLFRAVYYFQAQKWDKLCIERTRNIAVPVLNERGQNVLVALLKLNAVDADNRKTTEEIAKAISEKSGKQADANALKSVIAHLKSLGLVDTKEGRTGGCWLSESGRARAVKLQTKL